MSTLLFLRPHWANRTSRKTEIDLVGECNGQPMNHFRKSDVLIAEGSQVGSSLLAWDRWSYFRESGTACIDVRASTLTWPEASGFARSSCGRPC